MVDEMAAWLVKKSDTVTAVSLVDMLDTILVELTVE